MKTETNKSRIQLQKNDGQTLAPVPKLFGWKDNPRDVEATDFKRLLTQINLGQHSTLLITPQGEVLGGNTRLKAYKKTKTPFAKVIVVDIKKQKDGYHAFVDGDEAKDIDGKPRIFDTADQAKLEYALSHNDMVGVTNEGKLAELLHANPLPMEVYKVSTYVRPIEDVAFEAGPSDLSDRPPDESDVETTKVDSFMEGGIKQMVLYWENAEFEAIMDRVNAVREGDENNTALFEKMLECYENNRSKKT